MAISNEMIAANANKFIKVNSEGTDVEYNEGSGGVAWGGITGTISLQYDLSGVLDGKSSTGHGHVSTDITGTAVLTDDSRLADDRTPTSHDNTKHSATYITQSEITSHASLTSSIHNFDSSGYGFIRDFNFALALGTIATIGTNKTNVLVVPRNGKIVKAFAYAKTAPTGADYIIDINLNGSTIWSTQTNRLKIVNGTNAGNQTSFNTTALTEGDLLTIDVDQVGSEIAGQDVSIILHCQLRNT